MTQQPDKNLTLKLIWISQIGTIFILFYVLTLSGVNDSDWGKLNRLELLTLIVLGIGYLAQVLGNSLFRTTKNRKKMKKDSRFAFYIASWALVEFSAVLGFAFSIQTQNYGYMVLLGATALLWLLTMKPPKLVD